MLSDYVSVDNTFLQNNQTHVPLTEAAGSKHKELNCYRDTYCLWLEVRVDNSSVLHWNPAGSRLSVDVNIIGSNMTSSSLLTLWDRQAQPTPGTNIQDEGLSLRCDQHVEYWMPRGIALSP